MINKDVVGPQSVGARVLLFDMAKKGVDKDTNNDLSSQETFSNSNISPSYKD